MINGATLLVPGGFQGIDDEEFGAIDGGLISREIDIPVEYLINGANHVQFEFGAGGFLSSTALTVTSTAALLGDCDLNGTVNFLDIAPFIAILSNGNFLYQADCDQNGVVDFLDISPFIAILSGGV